MIFTIRTATLVIVPLVKKGKWMFHGHRSRQRSSTRAHSFRPCLQTLEDRLLMSVVQHYAGIAAADEIDIGSSYRAPPDPGFAVGFNYVVELMNGAYGVYDTATGLLDAPIISSQSCWANAGLRGIDPYRMRLLLQHRERPLVRGGDFRPDSSDRRVS